MNDEISTEAQDEALDETTLDETENELDEGEGTEEDDDDHAAPEGPAGI